MTDVTEEHHHALAVIYGEEGWDFQSGVPDGVEDGWFHQDLGVIGRVPPDEDEEGSSGGPVAVWMIDGTASISYDGDLSLSPRQARVLLELLAKAIEVAEAYQPPMWMLDPAQLHQHKVDVYAEVIAIWQREVDACTVCPSIGEEPT